jgi:hypothetical protein
MTGPIGTYTFLPWVRLGLANHIGPATATRPAIEVKLDIEGTNKAGAATPPVGVTRTVELYGPGDIIGVDSAQFSRIEPPNWVTNFEPNYLAAIEFYDEDFPWRYTPGAAADRKLRPWLALVVLEEPDGDNDEFTEGGNVSGKPLSYIDVKAGFSTVFPDAADGWAWAHAHFNAEFSSAVVETDATKASQAAQHVIASAPDTACSRILCPRKLKPTTGYHAFLVPAFESGRLAGLGLDPQPVFAEPANGLTAMSSAWGTYGVPANRPAATSFPYYYRWYFRTAENGDFESLVRALKPQPVDSRVGHRDIDVAQPAPNIVGIDMFDGELRMGGALKAPYDTLPQEDKDELDKYENWATPYPQPFQTQVAAFVNLADSYQQIGPEANDNDALQDDIRNDPLPLITPPLYGRWHALTERLLTNRDGSDAPNRTNWVHDLNLDPRWRAAAGFGTKVVQGDQEKLMEGAWEQIGDVLEANRRIRQGQLAKYAGMHLHAVHMSGAADVSPSRVLILAAPLTARIVSDGVTIRHRQLQSPMHTTLTSSAMRRTMRPGGPLAKRLDLTDPKAAAGIVEQANDGSISAAPPRQPPDSILTPDDFADAASLTGFQAVLARIGRWLNRHTFLAVLLVLLVLALILAAAGFSAAGFIIVGVLVVVVAVLWWLARRAAARQDEADRLGEDAMTPAAVDAFPGSANFTLVPQVDPRNPPPFTAVRPGEQDNAEAKRFKDALRDGFRLIDTSRTAGKVPPTTPLPLLAVADDIVAGTRPEVTVPRWIWSGVTIPERIRDQMGEDFVEVLAYPEFDIPMYEPLSEDKDGFVPNIHLVEPNSVTLLETNQRFIESYMVGLNHEFARELLWREYPTDQRGSYFRQFWDVRKKLAEAENTLAAKAAAREKFKDIKPLHRWPRINDLGLNDNREEGPEAEEELVLVIRGELLKKYPNTVISAQPAKWQLTNGKPDKSKERQLDENFKPIFPLYEARVEPDIYFFGFDLTAKKAQGDDTVDHEPGWFFRIEEVPGDARFGFDISRDSPTINVWNDLSWADVGPVADGGHLKAGSIPSRTLVEPTGSDIEKHPQWEFDRFVPLDASLSAAELAYIALQTPVIMAVHASELLPDQESE